MSNENRILSDKYDNAALDFEEAKEQLAIKKFINAKDEEYLMGINSPLLTVPNIAVFDHAVLLEKYPQGLVTESFVLIPVENFIKIKEKATTRSGIYNQEYFAVFFNEYMTKFLEVSLNIDFSDEEKKVLKEQVKQVYVEDLELNIDNIVKTTNRDLLKDLKGEDLYFVELLKIRTSLEKEVKQVLKENEKYIEKLPSLQKKANEVKLEDINSQLSVEEFIKIIEQVEKMEISPVITLKIINKMSDELYKEVNGDLKKFNQEAKDNLFPCIATLGLLQYQASVAHIVNNFITPTEKNMNDNKEARTDLANSLVTLAHPEQRDVLIKVATGFDKINGMRFRSDPPKRKMN